MNVNDMVNTVSQVLNATSNVVDSMNVNDRMSMKDLTQKVATEVAMQPSDIVSFVTFFVHNSDVVITKQGKGGGVIKIA